MSSGKRKVVIIGAGAVGSTYAFALQVSGTAREIVLIDIDRDRAEGQAMDLNHGLFFTDPVEIRAGDYGDCADADIVAITAGAAQKSSQSRMELAETNVGICKEVVENILDRASDPILLVVTNPVDVLTYAALKRSGLPAGRVIGSGTVIDSARFRYLLSRHCRINPRNVHAYVLGEHGDSEVFAWSMTHFAGVALDEFCRTCPRECTSVDRDKIARQVRESAYHIIDVKGATNWAVALALERITASILRDENSILTVSTMLKGEFGIEDVCLSVPTVVNSNGAETILNPSLSQEEIEALRLSAEAIKKVLRRVGLQ